MSVGDWNVPDVSADEVPEEQCGRPHHRQRWSREAQDVAATIEEIERELAQHKPRQERLLKKLDELAAMPTARALSTRHWLKAVLTAVELLMRHEGMLVEKHDVDVSGSVSMVLKQALDRVQRMHLSGTN